MNGHEQIASISARSSERAASSERENPLAPARRSPLAARSLMRIEVEEKE